VTAVPAEAITAARAAIPCTCDGYTTSSGPAHFLECDTQTEIPIEPMLEAAEPHLAAARAQAVVDTLTIRPDSCVIIRTTGTLSPARAQQLLDQARLALGFRDARILLADDSTTINVEPDKAAAATRIAELEQLASDILATFTRGSDGWRARVSQVSLQRYRDRLAGPSEVIEGALDAIEQLGGQQ
jgi:hypothetical protein